MPRERRNSIIDVAFVLALRGFGMVLGIVSAFGVVFLFGASAIVDAYFFARRTIGSIQSVIEVLIETLMVPAMVRHQQRAGVSSLIRLSHRLERWVFLGGVTFSVIAGLCAGLLVDLLAPGLSGEARAPAILYFCLLLVTVPITLLTSVDSATLVALRQFSRPAAVRLLPRAFLVAALAAVPFGLGLSWAVASFVLGTLVMMVVFQVMSRRILRQARAAAQTPVLTEAHGKLDMTVGHAAASIVFGLFTFVEMTLDTFFASQAGVGALAILTVGQRISNVGASEMTRSLLSVYYSNLAECAALGQTQQFVAELANAIRAVVFFIAPLGFFLFALATPLCAVLLDFGAFGSEAITATSAVVAWVAVATVLRGPVAMQESAVLADPSAEHLTFAVLATGLSLIVRISIVVTMLPGHGLIAVVYSAIGATLFRLVFGFVWLRIRGNLVFETAQIFSVAVVLCLAALSATASAVLVSLLPEEAGRLSLALAIGFSVLTMTLVYVFAAAGAGINEGRLIKDAIFRRLSRSS